MSVKADEAAIPSGVEIDPENPEVEEGQEQGGTEPVKPEEGEDAPRKYAGKYETAEALEAAHEQLVSKLGEQGTKIEQLNSKLNELGKKPAAEQDKGAEPSIDDRYAQLEDKLSNGDIDAVEYARQSRELDREQREAERIQWEKDNHAKEVEKKWLQDNPQFSEMHDSGEINAFLAENPLHDSVSAYYAIQMQKQSQQMADAITKAREEGKAEGLALAKGSSEAKQVIAGAGVTQPKKTGPVSSEERTQRMLTKLKQLRNGG